MTKIQTLHIGDILGIKLEKYNIFYPCQIVGINPEKIESIAVVLMNYFNENLPSVDDLKNIKPLVKNHHNWNDETMAFWTDVSELKNLPFIGNTKPIYDVTKIDDDKSIFNQFEIELQFLWQKLPLEKIEQYKTGMKSRDRITTKISISEQKDKLFWGNLNNLPCLTDISCTYWHDEVLEYVSQNPLISELELRNVKSSTIDISQTAIQKLILDVTNVEEIILNRNIQFLNLFGDFSSLKCINDMFDGKHTRLFISKPKTLPKFFGLKKLEKLSIVYKNIDTKEIIDQFSHLRNLTLWGENGNLSNILELQRLKNLEHLTIYDAYGFDDFPNKEQLPNLHSLTLSGIPKTAGQKAKKEFAKIGGYIHQLRDENWLKANLDNPFNSWDGRDGTKPANAKKAMKNYTDTYKKLTKKGTTKEESKEILLKFIEVFNDIDRKNSIDTLEREEILDVFEQLAKVANLTTKECEELFEETRDF